MALGVRGLGTPTTWSRMRLAQSTPSADEIHPRVGHVLVKNGEGEMIKKVKEGYKVTSSKGKNLGGPYKSKEAAKKRLRQVEFFKHSK